MSERENEQVLAYLIPSEKLDEPDVVVEETLVGNVGYNVDSAAMLIRIWDSTEQTWILHTPRLVRFIFDGTHKRRR